LPPPAFARHRLTRRAFGTGAAATAAAVLVGCTGEDDDPADAGDNPTTPDAVTYLTGFNKASHDAFAWVGREQGIYNDAGIDIDIQLGTGPTSGAALLAGSAQFAKIDMTTLMVQVGRGEAEGLVAVSFVEQLNLCAIIAPVESGIASPQDLEGKRLAALQFAVPETLFAPYADLAGIDASQVEIVNGEAQDLYGMVASGQVDGVLTFTIQQGVINAVVQAETVALPYSDFLPDLGGNVIATTRAVAEENPDMVIRFRDASLRAVQAALADPTQAMTMMAEEDPAINVDAGAAEIERIAPLVNAFGEGTVGVIDEDRVARSIAVLQANGLLPAGLTADSILDPNVSLLGST
jgi:NitT/TauT family transport system substrate-binding protein